MRLILNINVIILHKLSESLIFFLLINVAPIYFYPPEFLFICEYLLLD